MQSGGEPTWSLAQAAVDRVDAALRLQAAGRRLGQVAAEAGVAGLAGEPLQAGVGERRHVLPAPVGHIDLPQPHPRRHRGLVLREMEPDQSSSACRAAELVLYKHQRF